MRNLKALIKKEFLQIVRDPSSLIVAFILPFMLLNIYMYGINLDTMRVSLGITNEDLNPETQTLVKSFGHSKYVKSKYYENRNSMYTDMIKNKIRGAVIIPNDFSKKLSQKENAQIQIITDGTEINTSNAVNTYTEAIVQTWLQESRYKNMLQKQLAVPIPVYRYNQDINSHQFILPGSLAVTMTLIGILLTALVIAREWERGTMETLLTTNISKMDIILGKYIPYYILGMVSMIFSISVIIAVFKIPFRGSFLSLFFVSSLFLLSSLGFGLMISTIYKNQFLASQSALSIGFMPSLMLSGLMYPVTSMPLFIRWVAYFIPAKYFVTFVESEFMTGSLPRIILINSIYLSLLGGILFYIVYKKTKTELD